MSMTSILSPEGIESTFDFSPEVTSKFHHETKVTLYPEIEIQ